MATYKVITVSSVVDSIRFETTGFNKESKAYFKETQYPELNKLLEEGYLIQNTILINPQSPESSGYFSVVFILVK